MAKKKKEKDISVQYEDANVLVNSIGCLVKNSDKAKTLRRAAKMYSSFGDYEDSPSLAQKCLVEAEKYDGESDNLPEPPKNPLDEKKTSKAFVWGVRIVALCVIIGILGAFYLTKTEHGRYIRSTFYEKIGDHQKAYKLFYHLEDYKDSKQRFRVNKYKQGCIELKNKNYEKARKHFRDISDYKDSSKKLAKVEMKILKDSKKHDDVLFGEAHWIVAEKKKDKLFLIKTKPVPGIAYNTSDESVTWKTSSIREYLNTTFIFNTFNPYMEEKILDSKVKVEDNKQFKTKGSSTTDKIFMLNEEQVYKYGDDLDNFKRDYWLIGPGETQREAQFISFGQVKEAGYPVTDRYINTRPCMWVNIK